MFIIEKSEISEMVKEKVKEFILENRTIPPSHAQLRQMCTDIRRAYDRKDCQISCPFQVGVPPVVRRVVCHLSSIFLFHSGM